MKTIAPAAKPMPYGKTGRKASTSTNAGTAKSGCGSEETMLHSVQAESDVPLLEVPLLESVAEATERVTRPRPRGRPRRPAG